MDDSRRKCSFNHNFSALSPVPPRIEEMIRNNKKSQGTLGQWKDSNNMALFQLVVWIFLFHQFHGSPKSIAIAMYSLLKICINHTRRKSALRICADETLENQVAGVTAPWRLTYLYHPKYDEAIRRHIQFWIILEICLKVWQGRAVCCKCFKVGDGIEMYDVNLRKEKEGAGTSTILWIAFWQCVWYV